MNYFALHPQLPSVSGVRAAGKTACCVGNFLPGASLHPDHQGKYESYDSKSVYHFCSCSGTSLHPAQKKSVKENK